MSPNLTGLDTSWLRGLLEISPDTVCCERYIGSEAKPEPDSKGDRNFETSDDNAV